MNLFNGNKKIWYPGIFPDHDSMVGHVLTTFFCHDQPMALMWPSRSRSSQDQGQISITKRLVGLRLKGALVAYLDHTQVECKYRGHCVIKVSKH